METGIPLPAPHARPSLGPPGVALSRPREKAAIVSVSLLYTFGCYLLGWQPWA